MAVSALVFNERTRLLAAALNTAGTSSFTIGVLAPLAASFYAVPGASHVATTTVVTGIVLWFLGATILHLCARVVLGSLRND